ncbi:MAG: prolyl oligopeptidase family serine peptidase [Acidimicrobiales bacterium]
MSDARPDSFPRQQARTQRFTLGAPRNLTVAPDGGRVAFLRSAGPEDALTSLWVLDVDAGTERVVADPRRLLAGDPTDLPPEERVRRERARESAAGITGYATDTAHRVTAAALAGQLVVADLESGAAELQPVPSAVIDPRPDPTGQHVAWVDGRRLWVLDLADRSSARELVGDDDPEVRWGVAEFAAAEEMDRYRGFWWAPDGSALLVARVDDTPVQRWWIADPAHPEHAPTQVAYPAAGTPNALVTAWIVRLDGTRTEVTWDRDDLPYLAEAGWDAHGPFLALHPRDQRRIEVRGVDPATGATESLWIDRDASWVERAPGTPARLADGRLVMASDTDGQRRLLIGGTPVTPDELHVRAVVGAADSSVVFTANAIHDATATAVWRWTDAGVERLTADDGVHTAVVGGDTVVVRRASLDQHAPTVSVVGGPTISGTVATPLVTPNVTIRHVGARRLATALLLPHDASPDVALPVLLDPYGGPHAQRVVQARSAHLTSQWFADQGFAVVVIDGRGTPGRGSEWERAIHGDLAAPVLEDQIDGLLALAAEDPRLDLSRVAIRGWSFGGYLAALAVLRRPDVVHAAIAGAPVTDWRLYDTFYTERYLGDPATDGAAYDASSVLLDADKLEHPLLLVHGLADDNVVSAHTLLLSSALLSAGRPHQVLPLTGVTHMANQEDVAENLLLFQLAFLRDALSLSEQAPRTS